MSTRTRKKEEEVEEVAETVPSGGPIPIENVDWEGLLAGMSSSGGDVFYPKQGRTNFRLMPPLVKEVFVPVTAWYQGKSRTKYIVAAWGKDLAGEGDDGPTIKAVLIPKRTCQAILGMQMEGWDLFSAKEGHPIGLVKDKTTTNVLVSPKAAPIPDEVIEEYKTFDIRAIAESWSKFQADRNANGGGASNDDDDDESTSNKKSSAPQKEEDW